MVKSPDALPRRRGEVGEPASDFSALQLHRGRKHHEKGVTYARAGKWRQALPELTEAVYCAPNQRNFNYALGIALCQFGRFVDAIEAFQRELVVNPDHPSSLTEIGTCLARTGRTREGILYLQRGLAFWPSMMLAQFSLGLALLTEKRREAAIGALDRAISLDPSYVNSYRTRGLAYALGGDEKRATDDLKMAAALDSKDYYKMLGLGAKFTKKMQDFQAGSLFEMAAKIAPNIALPQLIFGNFLINHRSFELGLSYVDRAIELEPLMADAHTARGYGLLGQGRIEEAVTCYLKAIELKPENADLAGAPLFALQHKPGVTKTELLQAHKKWAALYRPLAPNDRLSFTNDANAARKPRLGIVSADLRGHAVTFLTLRAFEQLAALGYEIHCYKTDRKYRDDEFSERYKAFAKSWDDVTDLDDSELSTLIAEHNIDILFDLSGHTTGNRLSLFAKRAAPIQLTWAGYVGTVGLDTIDGIIADPVEVPPCDHEFYVESIVRLPDCYVCYHPPLQTPNVGPLPFLDTGTFTFGCFNRPAKLNPEIGHTWSKILEKVPNSRILMVYGSLNESGTREAVWKTLESGGLSRDRVDLVGETEQPKLLEAYAEKVDLALDPFPYSGGVTTLEAMWMGVPTVTLVGDTFAGRHAASHLTAAGLGDFCANSIDEYINLAVSWVKRPDELAALRMGLRNRVAASPLNDQVRFGKNLDEALMSLWRDWCAIRLANQGANLDRSIGLS